MPLWRKLLLGCLVIAMAAGILLTWGSIFSILMALGLLYTAGILLYQKYILDDGSRDDWGEQNG